MRAKILATVVAAAALTLSAPLAHANSILELVSGGSTVTGALIAPGAENFSGTVGGWTVNVTTGLASPADGGVADSLDVSSTDLTAAGAGPLTILWGATPYSQPGTYEASIGGTLGLGTSLTFSSFYGVNPLTGPLNVPVAGFNALTAPLSFSLTPFSGANYGVIPANAAAPFALLEQVVFSGGGLGSQSSFDANLTAVPDGGSTLILLGGAITAMTLIRSKKSKK